MAIVRQHYKLATEGKLGQKTSGKGLPKGGRSKASDSTRKGSGGYGGSGKKTPC